MIPDSEVERAVTYYRDNADRRGQLKGMVEYLGHAIKVVLGQAFLNAEGTVAEREAISRQDPEYLKKVDELKDAVTELQTLETLLKAAELKISIWQTQSANSRRGHV